MKNLFSSVYRPLAFYSEFFDYFITIFSLWKSHVPFREKHEYLLWKNDLVQAYFGKVTKLLNSLIMGVKTA